MYQRTKQLEIECVVTYEQMVKLSYVSCLFDFDYK